MPLRFRTEFRACFAKLWGLGFNGFGYVDGRFGADQVSRSGVWGSFVFGVELVSSRGVDGTFVVSLDYSCRLQAAYRNTSRIANIILGVPYYNYSIMRPKTLF